MKILVTGGGGFLGQAICQQLVERGDQVISFNRSHYQQPGGVSNFQGNIANASEVLAAAEGCDVVIHTAAKAGIWGDPQSYESTNITGTESVIKACKHWQIPYLVYTSSPSVIHSGGDIENGNEDLPYPDHFSADYPRTKAIAEQAILAANGSELKTTALRPHLIWGPGDNHLLPRLIQKAQQGSLKLPGADKLIDTVYVANAAQAHLQALDELKEQGKNAGKAYFISNDEPLPQAVIIEKLLQAAGINPTIKPIPAWLAHTVGAVCETFWKVLKLSNEPPVTRFTAEQLSTAHWFNLDRAKTDFAYQPEISIEQGLKRLADSYQN